MIKLSDYVINFISTLGIDYVFLLPGGGCMHLVDSLGKCKSLKHICFLHEQAATIAAEAYGQYTNNIGVTLVTTGPGGTNAITGVAGAWIDSTPMLVLSGQAKRSDMIAGSGLRQMGIQEVDIVSIVKPITKYAVTVIEPNSIRYHLEKAVYLARNGRPGPVWIDIPLDVQGVTIDESDLKQFNHSEIQTEIDTDKIKKQVKESINLLNNSERPVILVGNGVRLAKAEEDFLSLIENLDVPVLTTWKTIDFLPEDHKLFFGRPGSIGQRGANFVQQNSDLIFTIGTRLDLAQVGHNYKYFAREAKKVVVDIDPAEINKMIIRGMSINIPIVADAKMFIREFVDNLDMVQHKNRTQWLSHCKEWKRKYPVILSEYFEKKDYVNTYALMSVLTELMTENDIMVPGSSGSCSEIALQSFKVKQGQRILNTPGLGSMGFGLPASIGACLASGNKRTISIIGDGGLQHNIQEFETLSRLKLPIKIFILNNNGYASIRLTQKRYFAGHYVCCDPSSGLTIPDTCKVATAYGLQTKKIDNQTDLDKKVKEVLDTDGTIICEVMVEPMLQTLPKLDSMVKPDGSIVSKPLEDLYPFLDREEFKANMIIRPIEE